MAVYVGSDSSLPLIEWNETVPSLFVMDLQENDIGVKEKFTKSNVVYIGSHEGCGCGFDVAAYQVWTEENSEYIAKRKKSVQQLHSYLAERLKSGPVEVYSCWGGDEASPAETRENVTISHFDSENFSFIERQFLTVTN